MIKVFYGDDRVRAKQAITNFLGPSYEVIEGADLTPADLPSIFLGNSLFAAQRNILIRDLFANKSVLDKLPDYLNTPHNIAIFELKLDKRSSVCKLLKSELEFTEFALPPDPNLKLVFNIYTTAKTDGKKAIQMLENIKSSEEPLMFFGLLASQAIKDYAARQGTKERRALKELSKLDLLLKSTKLQPWLLIESFLLRFSSL